MPGEVLAAAARLLGDGSRPLDMGEVARAAGVSRAALYRHVAGRRALLAELDRAGLADRRSVERAGEVRRRILDGARLAIERHGLLTATIEQVAEAAGVSAPTVYRTFADRDELMRAAFDELPARSALADLAARGEGPLRPALTGAVALMLELARRQPEMLRLVAFPGEAEARYLRRLRPRRGAGVRQLVRYLSEQQRRGRLRGDEAPERLAAALLGSVLVSGAMANAAEPTAEAATRLVGLFLEGAKR